MPKPYIQFQVSTRRTGMYRVVKVRLYDTVADLHNALERLYGEDETRHEAAAVMHPIHGRKQEILDRDPKPHLATVMLARDYLNQVVLVHEMTHVVALLYNVDSMKENSRATAHLNERNETLAYLMNDLFVYAMLRFQKLGIEVPLGNPDDFGF